MAPPLPQVKPLEYENLPRAQRLLRCKKAVHFNRGQTFQQYLDNKTRTEGENSMPTFAMQYLYRRPNLPIATSWASVEASNLVEVPLLGNVSAGLPIEACPSGDTILTPASMVRRNTYALRVRGNSMIDCNIFDGDVIIIERQESAENGETVVVSINQQEVTLKKLYIEKHGIRLQPANDSMEPIYLKNSDVQVLGMIMGVMRKQPASTELTH